MPQCPGEDPKTHRVENMGSPAGKRTTKTHRVPAVLHRGDPGWGNFHRVEFSSFIFHRVFHWGGFHWGTKAGVHLLKSCCFTIYPIYFSQKTPFIIKDGVFSIRFVILFKYLSKCLETQSIVTNL